jgi:hypothetical protein
MVSFMFQSLLPEETASGTIRRGRTVAVIMWIKKNNKKSIVVL